MLLLAHQATAITRVIAGKHRTEGKAGQDNTAGRAMHVQHVPFPPAWDKDSDQESKLGPNSQLLKWPQQNLLLQTAPWLEMPAASLTQRADAALRDTGTNSGGGSQHGEWRATGGTED